MTPIQTRTHHEDGRWWMPFLLGATAGLLAGTLLRRGGTSVPLDGAAAADRWARLRAAWEDAVDGAADGIAAARDLLAAEPLLDAGALEERVTGLGCATECRIRVLGPGIVEVVGSCTSDDNLRVLLDAVSAAPGVEVVVNRVWTPESASSDEPAAPGAH